MELVNYWVLVKNMASECLVDVCRCACLSSYSLLTHRTHTCSKRDVVGAKTKTKTAYGRHVVGKATYSKEGTHTWGPSQRAQSLMQYTGDMHYFVSENEKIKN